MSLYKVLVTVGVTLTTVTIEANNYCSVKCAGSHDRHTMCKYRSDGGRACPHLKRGLRSDEKTLVLDLHNKLRQKVALGRETRWRQPPASNMIELQWDKELEMIAQRWADQCSKTPPHDGCRNSLDRTDVGQNVYHGHVKDTKKAIKQAVMLWYNEVKGFKRVQVRSYSQRAGGVKKTGHYSQVVWAETSRIGCGYVHNREGRRGDFVKLVCNYKKSGNYDRRPVYRIGRACSACPVKAPRCSSRWKGLCTSSRRG